MLSKLFIDPSRMGIGIGLPSPHGIGPGRTNHNWTFLFPTNYVEQLVERLAKSLWRELKILDDYYFRLQPKVSVDKQFASHAVGFGHRVSGVDGHRGCVGSCPPANGRELNEIDSRGRQVTPDRPSSGKHRHMSDRAERPCDRRTSSQMSHSIRILEDDESFDICAGHHHWRGSLDSLGNRGGRAMLVLGVDRRWLTEGQKRNSVQTSRRVADVSRRCNDPK